jgi:hypothetical protein
MSEIESWRLEARGTDTRLPLEDPVSREAVERFRAALG